MSTQPPDEAVIVERRVNAPPSTVYALLTRLDWWLASREAGASVDPRPGGAFRMFVAGRAWAAGQFTELIPDRLVVVTWGWESADYPVPPGSSRVQIDLIPDGDGHSSVSRIADSRRLCARPNRHGWIFHLEQIETLTR